MERKWHIFISCIVFIILFVVLEIVTITSIVLPLLWATIPDRDHRDSKSHRNMVWHSVAMPLIIFIFMPIIHFALLILSAGMHCLLDVRLKKVSGFYTVKWYRMHSVLGYKFATSWYLMNFIVSVIIFMVFVWIKM